MAMHSVEEDVTPARARKDLETAQCGRKPSQKVIFNYTRDMKARHWALSGEPVIYDTDCVLRDGQQRFLAVIQAAMELANEGVISDPEEFSVRMLVTYDMPKESFPFLNSGKPRSLADNWYMEGREYPVLLHAVTNRIAMWEAGHPMGNAYRPTAAEKIEVLERHPEAADAAEFARGWTVKPPVPSAGIAGFLWYLLGEKNAADRDFFMEGLRAGDGLSAADDTAPILLLRARLHGDFYDARTRGTSVKPSTQVYLCLRAWDAWRTKENIKKLQMPTRLTDKSFKAPR